MTTSIRVRLVCQAYSKASCHKHHHQIEGCHLLGDDGGCSQRTQIVLDLPMTPLTALWVTLYQWVTKHFLDRNIRMREQWVARGYRNYE